MVTPLVVVVIMNTSSELVGPGGVGASAHGSVDALEQV